jgi:hypothetical protein
MPTYIIAFDKFASIDDISILPFRFHGDASEKLWPFALDETIVNL